MTAVYTKKDLAVLLKVSQRTIQKLVSQKNIRHFRIGKDLRFTEDSVQEFINKQEGGISGSCGGDGGGARGRIRRTGCGNI